MLADLYTAIATATVTVDGDAIAGTALDEVREYLPSAHLPCRLMLAYGRAGATDRIEFTSGSVGTVESTYQVTDLFLYKEIIQGQGLIEAQPVLVAYRDGYITMAMALRGTLDDCYTLLSLDLSTGPQQWDGVYYHGVEAVWTVSVLLA